MNERDRIIQQAIEQAQKAPTEPIEDAIEKLENLFHGAASVSSPEALYALVALSNLYRVQSGTITTTKGK